jgi:hypothetical protein
MKTLQHKNMKGMADDQLNLMIDIGKPRSREKDRVESLGLKTRHGVDQVICARVIIG